MRGRGNMRLEDEADRIRALLDNWYALGFVKKSDFIKKKYKLYIILKNYIHLPIDYICLKF